MNESFFSCVLVAIGILVVLLPYLQKTFVDFFVKAPSTWNACNKFAAKADESYRRWMCSSYCTLELVKLEG